jgi:prepilin-type N-terminal cleavage/methylation domain-containing protein
MFSNGTHNYRYGFTLVEVVVTLALVSIIGALSVSGFVQYKQSVTFESIEQTLEYALRRANHLSSVEAQNTSWGVFVEETAVTVFMGDSYATRTTDSDEILDLAEEISIVADQEIVFNQGSGLPTSPAHFELVSNDSITLISVLSTGALMYE